MNTSEKLIYQKQTTLVVGASGSTGKELVNQLLKLNQNVKIVVRSVDKIPTAWKSNSNITIIENSILNLTDLQMRDYVKDCNAIASCLGHNLTFKGIYGHPRRLVTDATKRLVNAAMNQDQKERIKFVLMNTSGNSNRDLNEVVPFSQKCVITLLRLLLPPHVDNEKAADYLRTEIGQNHNQIDWVAVRPDGLVNEDNVSAYKIHKSPNRNPIFNAGKVSRINVANFMAKLIVSDKEWQNWKGQMPVIYNKDA